MPTNDITALQGDFYSYNKHIQDLRSQEIPKLKDTVYLDHAGAALYTNTQIDRYTEYLKSNIFGNPHSNNTSSQLSTDAVSEARLRVLRWLNADPQQYSVVFTSGCTAALKLVSECFRYKQMCPYETPSIFKPDQHPQSKDDAQLNEDLTNHEASSSNLGNSSSENDITQNGPQYGSFVYTEDCHTSVLGMAEVARKQGRNVTCLLRSHLQQYTKTGESLVDMQQAAQAKQSFKNCADPSSDHSVPISTEHSPVFVNTTGNHLFVYPAQSNFNGRRYPLKWIDHLHALNQCSCASSGECTSTFSDQATCHCQHHPARWFVLLDAASYLSTTGLDLSLTQPDFVTLSFYKLFGFPTGLGALIIRNSSAYVLEKNYFGGGTVEIGTRLGHVNKADISERFEDGTIAFLDIIALQFGFDSWQKISHDISQTSLHTFTLAAYVYKNLQLYQHGNGARVAVIYEDTAYECMEIQGPILAFNLLHADGGYIGYTQVEKLSSVWGIDLRVGCVCNMGSCQSHLNLRDKQIIKNYQAGHVCGDGMDLVDGSPTGIIRISFGYTSTLQDADKFLKFISECFIEGLEQSITTLHYTVAQATTPAQDLSASETVSSAKSPALGPPQYFSSTFTSDPDTIKPDTIKPDTIKPDTIKPDTIKPDAIKPDTIKHVSGCRLAELYIYPIKSCGSFQVSSWPLGERGLLYDRQWMVIQNNTIPLTQKRVPQMCLIKPTLDRIKQLLTLTFPGVEDLSIPLHTKHDEVQNEAFVCQSKVCGDKVFHVDCGDEAAAWLEAALGRAGIRLVRQQESEARQAKKKPHGEAQGASLSLANEAQISLINIETVRQLQNDMSQTCGITDDDVSEMVCRFRSNLVVEGATAWQEESWQDISIGEQSLVVVGGCSRCQMVCVDQSTGVRGHQPLRTIATTRGTKVLFGILLQTKTRSVGDEVACINIGDRITVLRTA